MGHWLAYALGWQDTYSGQGHALAQVQGFLMAFALGFLGTMLPRRMGAAPVPLGILVAWIAGLVVTTWAALAERWLLAEAAALGVLVTLLGFGLSRLAHRGGGRRPPDAFVLLPIAFVHALLGVVLLLLAETGLAGERAVAVARGLLQEGVFLCLILGVGRMVLPLLSGWPVPPDLDATGPSRLARLGHAAAGLAILASFPAAQLLADATGEATAMRVAHVVRGGVVVAELLVAGAWRRPRKAGTQRRLVLIAAWLVPAGLFLAAAFPARRVAFLHVTFVGGMALMALAIAAHVILAHGGHEDRAAAPSRGLRVFGALVLLAAVVRATSDFMPESFFMHLGAAAGVWLLALSAWMACILPRLRDRRPDA